MHTPFHTDDNKLHGNLLQDSTQHKLGDHQTSDYLNHLQQILHVPLGETII